jgi:predicted metal-binding protein
MDVKILESEFQKHGLSDFKWTTGLNVVIAQWVRFKCIYGCDSYAKFANCPPNTPSIEESIKFFREYNTIAVFHFEQIVKHEGSFSEWTKEISLKLLEIEKKVFLAGYTKAFSLSPGRCCLCDKCVPLKENCKNKTESRPSPQSLSVDVFSTVNKIGYNVKMQSDFTKKVDRFAFLLVK